MTRNLTKTDRTCPQCSHLFGAVAPHCICPECGHRFFALEKAAIEIEETALDPEWVRAYDAICARVEHAIGEDTDIKFSAYAEDENGIPLDNLDEVAYRDYVVIVAEREEYWGGPSSEAFQSEFLDEPTWLDLCKVAHRQSKVTRDLQHVYIEGIEKVGWIKVDGRSAAKCELLLGS